MDAVEEAMHKMTDILMEYLTDPSRDTENRLLKELATTTTRTYYLNVTGALETTLTNIGSEETSANTRARDEESVFERPRKLRRKNSSGVNMVDEFSVPLWVTNGNNDLFCESFFLSVFHLKIPLITIVRITRSSDRKRRMQRERNQEIN